MTIALNVALPPNCFTVPEAAWAAGTDDRFVNQEVDAEIVELEPPLRRRFLALHDVLYLSAVHEVAAQFARELRKRIYVEIREAERRDTAQVMLTRHLRVHLTELRRALTLRTDQILAARGAVEVVPGVRGGAPVVRGTRIPVSALAAMVADGAAPEELAEQYDLDKPHVRLALLYDRLHPRMGRPSRAMRGRLAPSAERADIEDLGTLR